MRLFLALITLTLTMTADGLQFTVWSDTPAAIVIQVNGIDGATVQSPTIYTPTLGAGEGFGSTLQVSAPGSIRVRVWDGATDPSADQTFPLPAHHFYLPRL